MQEFVGTPKFHRNQRVKTSFPENSRHYSEGVIKKITENEIYKTYQTYNSITGEIEVEEDVCDVVGYHFVYTLDNGRKFDESLLIAL